MKKGKNLFIVFLFVFMSIFVTACGSTETSNGGVTAEKEAIEIRASGYKTEVEVGESYAPNGVKVEKKTGNTWKTMLKNTYVVECEYDGTKYGSYDLVVYLKADRRVQVTDTIVVSPKLVEIPTYSITYTGSVVNIKQVLQSNSNGLYSVLSYINTAQTGQYNILLQLTNPNEYTWVKGDGEVVYTPVIETSWEITKAPKQTYSGQINLDVNSGESLYQIANRYNLSGIYWNNEYMVINSSCDVPAIYNPDKNNYEDTPIVFSFNVIN